MKKTKCTKMVSLGIAMMILLSGFVLPTSAQEDNLFINPEFQITEIEEKEKILGWSLYGSGVMDNILTPDDTLYDENANMDGNMFHSSVNGAGLISSDFLPLNEEGSALISVWYKSSSKNAIRYVIEGYDSADVKVESVNEYLPSTEGVWTKYDYKFTTTKSAVKVKVIIRLVNFTEKINEVSTITGPVETGNIYFMAPFYTNEVPKVYITNSDFETDGTKTWGFASSTDAARGNFEVTQENDGNKYLKIESTTENACRITARTDLNELMTNGKNYKFSFKFMPISEGSTPQLEIFGVNENGYQVAQLSAMITALGTLSKGTWTEYVCYFTLTGENTKEVYPKEEDAKKIGLSRAIQFRVRAKANETVGYDDFNVEETKNNAMIYQNGVETSILSPGAFSARYHNISDKSNTFIVALYKLNSNGRKILDKIEITTANANMTLASDDAVIDTITIPDDGGSYQVKAFALDGLDSLKPSMKAKTAKTASNTAA